MTQKIIRHPAPPCLDMLSTPENYTDFDRKSTQFLYSEKSPESYLLLPLAVVGFAWDVPATIAANTCLLCIAPFGILIQQILD